jgi:hypothetical protein
MDINVHYLKEISTHSLVERTVLMITSDQKDLLGISYFQ